MIKKKQPDLMTIKFNQFSFASDRCIYDKFSYKFASKDGGSLPSFISSNEPQLTVFVFTSQLPYVGTYKLIL